LSAPSLFFCWRVYCAIGGWSCLPSCWQRLISASLSPGCKARPAPGSERFLRVVTFWGWNERMDDVAKFLRDSDADAVVLQEVSREHCAVLRRALQTAYPFVVGETELARHKGHEF
jgi:endonuclease/exonuclease/phosphatase (EEP) superfamily protein YafD